MALYEHVFLARQDLAQAQVDALAEIATKIVNDNEGRVVKTENWGLRSLAYKIAKNRKAIALTPAVRAEQLTQVPLKALPLMTEQWLDTQRKLLPAPAQTLVDGIGVKLETLSPQLATLDEREPVAAEVRKLIGEQLPELLKGYAKVPPPLRGVARNGKSPDAQLADALKLIDDEIGDMSAQIAQGDLDSLETRGRFLEIKYRDEV